MKSILLFFVLMTTTFMIAQTQLENPGFEGVWEDVAGSEDEPIQWSSIKTADALAALAPIVLFKSTDAHTGTYSIRLANTTAFGIVANGIVTNGRIHADFDAELGNVFTDVASEDWRTVFEDRPDSIVGWFKYSPMLEDRGKIEVLLHDNTATGRLPETGATDHWVGRARYDMIGTTDEWTRFSVPFNYLNDNSPNYVLVVISSGDSTIAVDGSQLWIDDIQIIYNPNSVVVTPGGPQSINIGEDGTLLTVTESANAAVVEEITREWKYSLTPGTGYVSFGVPQTGTTYTPNFAAADIYYVICETDFGTEVIVSNEVEIAVIDPAVNSVTISPSADQNLLTAESGTMLTASESPAAADSRTWKFSTTSGTGYGPFTPTQTALTYTPSFDAIGTYYVICESDFGGELQNSNEVVIHVVGTSGLTTNDFDFNLYSTGNNIVVNYTDFEGATLSIFGLDGKTIYTTALNGEITYHNLTANGIFVYQVRKNNEVFTGKIILE